MVRPAQLHGLRVEGRQIPNLIDEIPVLGSAVETFDDELAVDGPQSLMGAPVESCDDYRVAMALAAEGETTVEEAEAARVSFPGFWEALTTWPT